MNEQWTLLVDVIIGGVLIEAVVLWWWSAGRLTRRERLGLLATLAAGAFLMLALRAAIAASPGGLLLALCASLLAHVTYLGTQFRRDRNG